ncbi:MAG TPA: serine acetyltransferase [Bacteroidota bacterium]|nr:serine acetyltransferase [Bacteroidota bacterium]
MIRQDVLRAYNLARGSRTARIIELYRSPGVHGVIIFRFGHWLLGASLPVKLLLTPLYLYLDHRLRAKWGIQIQRRVNIGGGFYIGHYGGIFISDLATIGENCNISQDVTIGVAGEGARRGAPEMGDNVYVGPGAKVNGKIRVGNNVNIGPNAVVTHNIPDDALVHVPPMKVMVFPGRSKANKPPQSEP